MTNPLPHEIDVEDLARMTEEGGDLKILDVREHWEVDICSFHESIHIPMSQISQNLAELPAHENLVVVCHHGVRSRHVMTWLRQMGYEMATSLRGGIDAWAKRIDPEMATY